MCCRFLQALCFCLFSVPAKGPTRLEVRCRTSTKTTSFPSVMIKIPIGYDQVDFTEAGIVVAFHQSEALLFQPAMGGSF